MPDSEDKKILLELPYFPPISWFALAFSADEIVLEVNENYHKGGYRNRCQIVGANGVQRLTVPLAKGKNQRMPIREVEISYAENWQQIHWRSIEAAYGRSPFFEHFAPDLKPFFEKKFERLFDLNLALLEFVLKKTRFRGKISLSETWQGKNVRTPGDFRDTVSPKNTALPDWFFPARYPQVFEEKHGFVADLSALDLLFCCGNQAADILLKSKT